MNKTVDEMLAIIRDNKNIRDKRVIYDVDLRDCNDTLMGVVVTTTCRPDYSHRDNPEGNHNVYIYMINRDTTGEIYKIMESQADQLAHIPERVSGESHCCEEKGEKICAPKFHCGFETRELDAKVKNRVKTLVDELSNRHLIQHTTAAKVYAGFGLTTGALPGTKKVNEHARH